MDKKTEIALARRRREAAAVGSPAAAQPATANWWMYHGDPAHTGYVSGGDLDAQTVGSDAFTTLFTIPLGGSVLSVPAIVDGKIYVGLANSLQAQGGNGGALHKIDIATGAIVATFAWDLGNDVRDVHSFAGMGCTPAVINGHVYFGAFNGKMYCLDQTTLNAVWVTDLRNADPDHNQPVTNDAGVDESQPGPAAVIWTSPVLSADGTKLYVGCGEGENPHLFSFVFCLDTASGDVVWIYCTNKFAKTEDNQPNVLPAAVVDGPNLPKPFSAEPTPPFVMGCSVWGAIAYDSDLDRIYCPTGNQQPEPNDGWPWDEKEPPPFEPELPSPGYSNGVLALDAKSGHFRAFFQVPPDSNYRPSDTDIDVGGSPTIFTLNGTKFVGFGCKNGTFFMLDADDLKLVGKRQMLPLHKDGTQIEAVDAHPFGDSLPQPPNSLSNKVPGENFSGVFNTGAVYPGSTDGKISPRIFFGMGGPNYHAASPGIDFESTPFMRAIDLPNMEDAWPLDDGDPPRYKHTSRYEPTTGQTTGMYANAGESGLCSPAIVNDVVFCTTTRVSIYAFKVSDGSLLWSDDLGSETKGYNGGYGYCLGPAIWGNYVVAGALIQGRDGGVLKIYGKK